MNPNTLNERVARIEKNMAELQDLTKILLESQIRHEREAHERERRLDERINKLAIVIGELLRIDAKGNL